MNDAVSPDNYMWAEEAAIDSIKQQGWDAFHAPTYHALAEAFKESEKPELARKAERYREILAKMNCLTALYVRTLPDVVAISEEADAVVLVEVKSWTSETGNLAIEAVPYAINWKLSDNGVNVLYLAMKENKKTVKIKPTEEILPTEIRVPDRWNESKRGTFKRFLKGMLLPTYVHKSTIEEKGSRDPYFLIDERNVYKWYDIKEIGDCISADDSNLHEWM